MQVLSLLRIHGDSIAICYGFEINVRLQLTKNDDTKVCEIRTVRLTAIVANRLLD